MLLKLESDLGENLDMKKWMQALGLVYVLLLLGFCLPAVTADSKNNASFSAEETAGTVTQEEQEEEKQEKPKIAITFDDGPSAVYTPVLLDGLKERGVHATFFLIGKNIEQGDNAQIVKRMQEEGHLIGNHTYNHVEITRVSNETAFQELKKTNDLIESITGEPVEFMRPPFGLWQKELEQQIHVLPVLWTIDPLDWATENVDEIVNKVVTEAEENDMILLHDCYESSMKAALRIIDLLQAEGFEFVTVDELMVD